MTIVTPIKASITASIKASIKTRTNLSATLTFFRNWRRNSAKQELTKT